MSGKTKTIVLPYPLTTIGIMSESLWPDVNRQLPIHKLITFPMLIVQSVSDLEL